MKKEKIYNYFYIVNNLKNGHFYLGIHSTNKLADGYFGSGKLLKIAIKNYGKENFEITPLKFFGTRKELLAFEKEIVNERFLDYYKGICYNIHLGGEGGRRKQLSDEELRRRDNERSKKYYNENKDKFTEYSEEWRSSEQGKSYMVEWRKNNGDKKRKLNKRWEENNPEKVKESHRKSYQKNKKKRAEYHRQYQAKKKAEKQAAQQVIII